MLLLSCKITNLRLVIRLVGICRRFETVCLTLNKLGKRLILVLLFLKLPIWIHESTTLFHFFDKAIFFFLLQFCHKLEIHSKIPHKIQAYLLKLFKFYTSRVRQLDVVYQFFVSLFNLALFSLDKTTCCYIYWICFAFIYQ